MPLPSLALIGCDTGQVPSALGSAECAVAPSVAVESVAAAGSAEAAVAGVGFARGTGGYGKGDGSHSSLGPSAGWRALHARQAAYAAPPTMPAPSSRFTVLRMEPRFAGLDGQASSANPLMRGPDVPSKQFDE